MYVGEGWLAKNIALASPDEVDLLESIELLWTSWGAWTKEAGISPAGLCALAVAIVYWAQVCSHCKHYRQS
jgi:hypothetical protein